MMKKGKAGVASLVLLCRALETLFNKNDACKNLTGFTKGVVAELREVCDFVLSLAGVTDAPKMDVVEKSWQQKALREHVLCPGTLLS